MESRHIGKRTAWRSSTSILIVTLLSGGCAQIIGIEDLPPIENFTVRGTALGVLGPVGLELHAGTEVEYLTVTEAGTFEFESRLEDGKPYNVEFTNSNVPCMLRNQTGVITGADTTIELTCTVPSLASVLLSGIAPTIDLVPGTTEYVVDLALLQQSVTILATVATAGDALTIAGTSVVSGTPSAEIMLNLGDNPVDIVVENSVGWQLTYRLTLRRAAQLAQYVYGKASNTGSEDYFGTSVALSGDTLAVGAPYEDSAAVGINGDQADDTAGNSGVVYVFRRSGIVWEQEAYLKASNTDAGDQFGTSVALAGDLLAVGARYEDSAATGVDGDQTDNAASDSGAVYVFRRSGAVWDQEAYLKASNTGAGDQFGISVALSGDTLAVGAPYESSAATGVDGNQADNSALYSGAVYAFRKSGTVWEQEAYLKASNTDAGDQFGTSVALAGDLLAVGAHYEDSAATGVDSDQTDNAASDSGAVYVFRRSDTAWEQEAYLKASNTDAGDFFGISLALASDTLAVGAWFEDSAATSVDGNQADNAAYDSGAVYVFRRSGTAWGQEAYLKASNTGAGDHFGVTVALAGDTIAVGAYEEDSAATGVDGSLDDEAAENSGAVYLFCRNETVWAQETYLKASNTDIEDRFGYRVALGNNALVVGAYGEASAATGVNGVQADASATSSGAVYIFH